MSPIDFSETIERFTGFGSHYDSVRPAAPDALADLLLPVAQCGNKARLVVDLGCGTGLSTRYWMPHAERVIGIDPTASMREQAQRIGGANIEYREGFSHGTGMEAGCADLVLCGQSLHWMEPESTFREAARILREGGVFAAYDYDWPPSTGVWEVDQAYRGCMAVTHRLEKEHGILEQVTRWKKDQHLRRITESGCFRYTAEHLLHNRDQGNAERITGLALSQGHIQSLLKLGLSESELHLDRLREAATRLLGSKPSKWFWSVRVRLGVK